MLGIKLLIIAGMLLPFFVAAMVIYKKRKISQIYRESSPHPTVLFNTKLTEIGRNKGKAIHLYESEGDIPGKTPCGYHYEPGCDMFYKENAPDNYAQLRVTTVYDNVTCKSCLKTMKEEEEEI